MLDIVSKERFFSFQKPIQVNFRKAFVEFQDKVESGFISPRNQMRNARTLHADRVGQGRGGEVVMGHECGEPGDEIRMLGHVTNVEVTIVNNYVSSLKFTYVNT